jgi:hypothetical protein
MPNIQNIVLIAAVVSSIWSTRLLIRRVEKGRGQKHRRADLRGDGVTHSSSGMCRKG